MMFTNLKILNALLVKIAAFDLISDSYALLKNSTVEEWSSTCFQQERAER